MEWARWVLWYKRCCQFCKSILQFQIIWNNITLWHVLFVRCKRETGVFNFFVRVFICSCFDVLCWTIERNKQINKNTHTIKHENKRTERELQGFFVSFGWFEILYRLNVVRANVTSAVGLLSYHCCGYSFNPIRLTRLQTTDDETMQFIN